jgi:hypothetical protein
MIATIITFYVSFALIAFMLWMKRAELTTGRKYFVTRLAEENDHVFHEMYARVRNVISYFNKHTFIAFLQWIAVGFLSWLRRLYIKLFHLAHKHPHSKKVIDMVRGKGEIGATGGASFFLKQITPDPIVGSTITPTK